MARQFNSETERKTKVLREAPSQMSSDIQKGLQRSRLLFVDDESLVLQGLQRSLHSMKPQWEMRFVDNGEKALQMLSTEPYDAVITDMKMPGMDGAQLLEEVKQRHPEIVRIVLSGQSSQEAMLRSIGPTHQYLSKPCDPNELKLRLAQAFLMRDLLRNPTVRAVVSGLKSIPSLPSLYHEIMAELRGENTSLERVAQIISKDVGMTAKILQLANSAFMGVRCNVSSPSHAVNLIGMEMVKALVLSVHVFSQFEDQPQTEACWKTLWEHSMAVGFLAQRIAVCEKSPKAVADESFTAGLLHEVGKLVLLAQMPKEYFAVLKDAAEKKNSVAMLERERLGCTHADLGAYLISIWGLPPPLVHAVAFHDSPGESGEDGFSSLTAVHAADAVISAKQEPVAILQDVALDRDYLRKIGLEEREPAWIKLYEQQAGHGEVAAAKGRV